MKTRRLTTLLDSELHNLGRAIALVRVQSAVVLESFKELNAPSTDGKSGLQRRFAEIWAAVPAVDLSKPDTQSIALGAHGITETEMAGASWELLIHERLWLLATAYEVYERFVKDMYAIMGCADPSTWHAKDFGDSGVPPPASTVKWYRAHVRESRKLRDGAAVVNRLRKALSGFEALETQNVTGTDMRYWLAVITTMRHVIVHQQGEIEAAKLWRDLARASGRPVDQSSGGKYRAQIAQFLMRHGERYKLRVVVSILTTFPPLGGVFLTSIPPFGGEILTSFPPRVT